MRLLESILVSACLLFAATSCPAVDHPVRVGGENSMHPDISFFPAEITIGVGDTITFHSAAQGAGVEHNVHALDGSFRCARGCDATGGNGDPAGGDWSDTVTFDHVATIDYQCDPHAAMGMRGVIHVVEGSPPPPSNVPITSGFTGTWYDPNQAGHGIFLEVEPNNGLLAWWFTFSPNGDQVWFGNAGSIDPTTNIGTVNAVQTQGGEWIPNFNPANVTQAPWGTLTFTFTDCNHGRVEFNSTASGYASGGMDLTRLTLPAGLACP